MYGTVFLHARMPHTSILDHVGIRIRYTATRSWSAIFSEVLWQEAGHFEMFFHGSPQLLFFRLQGQVQSVNLICFLRPRWLKGPLHCNNCHVFLNFKFWKMIKMMDNYVNLWKITENNGQSASDIFWGLPVLPLVFFSIILMLLLLLFRYAPTTLLTCRWRPFCDKHVLMAWSKQITVALYSII